MPYKCEFENIQKSFNVSHSCCFYSHKCYHFVYLPVFHYLTILMISDSCFLHHHYFVESELLTIWSIFLTASPPPFFVFVFCRIFSSSLLISYIQLHLRYGHPNFLFFPPATFYMPHIYFMSFSLYVGLFLTSYHKTVFTVPILFLLSCGTKV